MIYAVIMAGGAGTRFWPRSTRKLPKQFLNLFGEGTMIQNTTERLQGFIPAERTMVITNADYVSLVRSQLPGLTEANIVGEPEARNTAPCVAIAAQILLKKDPDAVMIVLPADHHITDERTFQRLLQKAIHKAESGNYLVTIGIEPDHPETGFGYIHADKTKGKSILKVKGFTEKPDAATAEEFLQSGDYYWNSGMFVWRADTVLNEFKNHLPRMYELLQEISPDLNTDMHTAAVNEFYRACESVSIDYGIMEKSKDVYVVPGSFGWSDVGSWSAVYELSAKDVAGNVHQAVNITQTGSENNLIYSDTDKMISLVGVNNLAVVDTGDSILVCHLDKAQDVKEIIEMLKAKKEFGKYL